MSISVIHLTDIHMVADIERNTILNRREQLYNACCSVLCPNDTTVIVISGDIAFSGKPEEYDCAFDLIYYIHDKLKSYLNNDVKVLMVPGNHDCNFDGDISKREELLAKLDIAKNVDQYILEQMTTVQKNFSEFSKCFFKYDLNNLCNKYVMDCGSTKLLFQMVNTAWMSQEHEEPGKLFIPSSTLESVDNGDYDCVFTVMHHPYNWLNPDNCNDFLDFIRQSTDILIIGHQHRKDSFSCTGEDWRFTEFRGKELQSSSSTHSAFSIYQIDNEFQNITTYDFTWKSNLYQRQESSNMFMRNTLVSSLTIMPSLKYISEYIDDPGMNIIHESADNVKLYEIYCWPDLEEIEVQDITKKIYKKRISDNIPEQLLDNSISVVIGDSLSGKTSLAKMLFRHYIQGEKCCVLLDGGELNTTIEKDLRQRIENVFIREYSKQSLDKYRNLPPDMRILIIDNFENIPYHDERKASILSFLSQFSSNIILITDNEIEARLVCSKLTTPSPKNISFYRILYLGNRKRYKLIKKWYYLRNDYAEGDEEIEAKIENTYERINTLIGSTKGFIPATPIFLITILQNIDSIVPASFSGSQYGFLYEALITKSLSIIKYSDTGVLNIDINAMSNLAFRMIKMKINTFTEAELGEVITVFSSKKKVGVNTKLLLDNMLNARLIQRIGPNTYKFSYPYVLYYFAGRYIAYNLNDPEVKEQIEYMSQRLYNEKYGNIVIFVCHFANSREIIDEILLTAYLSLEKYEIFDFDKHRDVLDNAKDLIVNMLSESMVGTENDIQNNRESKLHVRDAMGIQDGSVYEPSDILDDDNEKEKDFASISAAMRTIDVLGQIIKNYPGDIDGDVKVSIIDEIHKLGMRIAEAMISVVGMLKKEFVEYVVNYVKDKKNTSDTIELVNFSQIFISWLVAGLTYGMIRKISTALCSEALLMVIQETFSLSSSLSQKLILQDLQFNVMKKPNFREAIQLYNEFEKSKSTYFAGEILRLIVYEYLTYNSCGYKMRAQLCEHFNLSLKQILIDDIRNSDI